MEAPLKDLDGGDLLLSEIREEASRLAHHPVEEIKRLEHVAEEGESPTTPLIVAVAVTAVLAVIVAAVTALDFGFYYAR